jgi:hypothetical protein
MTNQGNLHFRPMTPDIQDLTRLQRLFARNGTDRSLEAFEWMYLRNPTGRLYVDVAVDPQSDEFAAAYCSLPFHARLGGRRVLALQSLDTLTDEAHRGRGLFTRMARSVFARAAADGVAFIHGFPNANSAPGFFGKLGWTRLGAAPFLLRPLRTGYFLDRLPRMPRAARLDLSLPIWGDEAPRGIAIQVVHAFDASTAALVRELVTHVGVDRDLPYLDWRFVRKPGETYVIHVASRAGEPVGVCVSTTKAKHGGRVTYLLELAYAPGHETSGRALVRQALSVGAASGADAALAWCLPSSRIRPTLVQHGFFPLPPALRPIQLHWGALAFRSDAMDVGNPQHWTISYADSDTV